VRIEYELFFYTSALVKIYHDEEGADTVLEIYNSEGQITISELAKIEFYSTIYRKYRERVIDLETLNLLIEKFDFDVDNKYSSFCLAPTHSFMMPWVSPGDV
jgi:uncharacterized protein with PIN domain